MLLIPLWDVDLHKAYELQRSFPPEENGFVNAAYGMTREEFAQIRQLVYQNIREMADELLGGRVSPRPAKSPRLDPCDYCDYRQLCNAAARPGEGQEETGKGEDEE